MTGRDALAFVVTGPESYALQSYPLPTVGEDDGLLQVYVSGVDGSDVKYFKGLVAHRRNFPMIGGDEVVGRIAEVGPRARARWNVAPGDWVVVDPHLGCGRCFQCRRGLGRFCVEHRGYGARFSSSQPPHFLGGFAQYMYLFPETTLAPIGGLSPEVAVLIPSMLANGIQWASLVGGTRPGDSVLILGCGQQGLGCAVAAKEAGAARLIVAGLAGDELRFEAARQLGADRVVDASTTSLTDVVMAETSGCGVDLVIDVTGSPAAADQTIDLVRTCGRVVLAGLSGKESTLGLDRIVWREVALLGSYSHGVDAFERAVALAQRRAGELASIVSDRLPLERTADAVGLLENARPRPTKVVIMPWMEEAADERKAR